MSSPLTPEPAPCVLHAVFYQCVHAPACRTVHTRLTFPGPRACVRVCVWQIRKSFSLPVSTYARTLISLEETGSWLFDRSRTDFSFLTTLVAFVPSTAAGSAGETTSLAAVEVGARELVLVAPSFLRPHAPP